MVLAPVTVLVSILFATFAHVDGARAQSKAAEFWGHDCDRLRTRFEARINRTAVRVEAATGDEAPRTSSAALETWALVRTLRRSSQLECPWLQQREAAHMQPLATLARRALSTSPCGEQAQQQLQHYIDSDASLLSSSPDVGMVVFQVLLSEECRPAGAEAIADELHFGEDGVEAECEELGDVAEDLFDAQLESATSGETSLMQENAAASAKFFRAVLMLVGVVLAFLVMMFTCSFFWLLTTVLGLAACFLRTAINALLFRPNAGGGFGGCWRWWAEQSMRLWPIGEADENGFHHMSPVSNQSPLHFNLAGCTMCHVMYFTRMSDATCSSGR